MKFAPNTSFAKIATAQKSNISMMATPMVGSMSNNFAKLSFKSSFAPSMTGSQRVSEMKMFAKANALQQRQIQPSMFNPIPMGPRKVIIPRAQAVMAETKTSTKWK